ncbi:MAG: glycosyltransferase [Candidatus Helarchaeota archaeon]
MKLIGLCCPLVLATSKSLKKAILSYGVKSSIKILPCTVDIDKFKFLPKKKSPPYKILTLCNLIPRKGIDLFLKAVALLNRRDIEVLIRGEGPQKEMLFELVKQLELEEIVNFLGFVSEDEKAELFQNCDVFVLPSHKENFGVLLIEAMACGKPVIATRCGGPEDFVIPEVGILVPPGNSKIMQDALETMLDKIQIYDSLKIFQYAKEKFSYETIGRKLNNIYMSLIQ